MMDQPIDYNAAFGWELPAMASSVRAFAASLCRNRSDTDDIALGALSKAWKGRSGLARGTNLKAWLFTMVRNQFYSLTREHRRDGD